MKVKELISTLKAFDPEHDVLCWCEDLLSEKHSSRVFDIVCVDESEAQKLRVQDGIPLLKFGKTESSSPHVLIGIISDF